MDLLGEFFEEKLPAKTNGKGLQGRNSKLKRADRFPISKTELIQGKISMEQKNLPKNKATGPDLVPSEV